MIAVALALSVAGAPCDALEAGLRVGATAVRAPTGGTEAAFAVDLYGALPLEACTAWPLRTELQFSTTGAGALFGDGVEAVEVSTAYLNFALLAGIAPVLHQKGSTDFGLHLLAGPNLLLSRVGTRVYDQEESTWGARLLGRVAAGAFAQLDELRIDVRMSWALPRGDGLGILAGLGYRW